MLFTYDVDEVCHDIKRGNETFTADAESQAGMTDRPMSCLEAINQRGL